MIKIKKEVKKRGLAISEILILLIGIVAISYGIGSEIKIVNGEPYVLDYKTFEEYRDAGGTLSKSEFDQFQNLFGDIRSIPLPCQPRGFFTTTNSSFLKVS